ncbi:MAG: hypothetical protein AAGE18_01825 [Pseudomonadota bacterium]
MPLGLLQPGATGFWSHKKAPLLEHDPKDCRRVAEAVAHAAGAAHWSVAPMPEDEPHETFRRFTVPVADGMLQCLTHRYLRITALVPEDWNVWDPVFPEIICDADQVQREVGWTLATSYELNAPLDSDTAAALSKAELEMAKGWQAGSAGAILFNAWD